MPYFLFMTFWILLFVIFHEITHKYIDLLFLTLLAFFVGLYLSFINPRYYQFQFALEKKTVKVTIKGWTRFILVDVIIHTSMLVFIAINYRRFYMDMLNKDPKPFINAILILMLYLTIVDIDKIYLTSYMDLFILTVLISILYLII